MSGNFEGIKKQKFGVEIECTGLTRADAAKAISKVLGGSPEHLGGSYDKYNVRDSKDRKWSIVYDSSIRCVDKSGCSASRNYAVTSGGCSYDKKSRRRDRSGVSGRNSCPHRRSALYCPKSAESGEHICKQGKFSFRYASGVAAARNLLPEGRQRLP